MNYNTVFKSNEMSMNDMDLYVKSLVDYSSHSDQISPGKLILIIHYHS